MPVGRTANESKDFPPETLSEALSEALSEEELDIRARKRMEVGLSPRRPTAKDALQRPPDVATLPVPPMLLTLLLVIVLVGTGLLLAANLTGWRPGWWPMPSEAAPAVEGSQPAGVQPTGGYTLRLTEDFGSASSTLLQGEQRQEWRTELLAADSIYRIQVWPDHLAWSLLGLDDVADYRLQTSATVAAAAPSGYAGLIARYQDERHFYLFAVDGQGRYLVQRQDGDQATALQSWTPVAFLNQAGSSNILTLEDVGGRLRFYANGLLLHEIAAPRFGPGHVGLAGGALGSDVANMHFDWLQFYDVAD